MTDPAGADGPDSQAGVRPALLPIGGVPDGGGGNTTPDADGLVPGAPEPSGMPGPAAAAANAGTGAAPSGTPVGDGAGGAPIPAPVVGGDAGAVGAAVAAVSGGRHQQGPAADLLPGTGGGPSDGGGQTVPSVSAGYREDGSFGDPEPAAPRPGWGEWWDASTFPVGGGGFQAARAARDAADLSDFGGSSSGGGAAVTAPRLPVRRPPVRVPDDSFPLPSAPAAPSRSDNNRNEQSND